MHSDSLGDANMAEGVPSSSCVLKIGFLFDHVSYNEYSIATNTADWTNISISF